jgi:hypothetical protein
MKIEFWSIYKHDRVYGGPEEGGWWYDTWCHIKSFARLRGQGNEEAMNRLTAHLNRREDLIHPVSSVLSYGQYKGILEDFPGEMQKIEIPHYE